MAKQKGARSLVMLGMILTRKGGRMRDRRERRERRAKDARRERERFDGT